MTWYARHLYATPTPAVLARLRADRRLDEHRFLVPDLARFRTTSREVDAVTIGPPGQPSVTEYRDVVDEPVLPAGGLVVVRELSGPDDPGRDWLDTDAFDASVLDVPDQRLALDPDGPWAAARRFARALARATGATVALYVTDFWGGDCEVADGWVFDGDREVGYHQAPPHARARVAEGGAVRERQIVRGDPLTLTMLHFDALLARGFFQLHTRGFPWDDYLDGG
ncbi:MAG: hypothetical protein JNK64_18145 [Myxococcales bacterium]|nr:hypothetical protein [Myxococcales bacterium]